MIVAPLLSLLLLGRRESLDMIDPQLFDTDAPTKGASIQYLYGHFIGIIIDGRIIQ
jgi:hypothetical protein